MLIQPGYLADILSKMNKVCNLKKNNSYYVWPMVNSSIHIQVRILEKLYLSPQAQQISNT